MIQLTLDWREVLWWMQGGMAGSHLRWSVYEDMVNRVWPQATEQERRNIFLTMRRDLGYYWRPDGWNGHSHMREKGEGPWNVTTAEDPDVKLFRHVLARFNPDEQYAVTMRCDSEMTYLSLKRTTNPASIISLPQPPRTEQGETWESPTATIVVRAYKWEGQYRIDWARRCAEDSIIKVEHLDIPDDGTM